MKPGNIRKTIGSVGSSIALAVITTGCASVSELLPSSGDGKNKYPSAKPKGRIQIDYTDANPDRAEINYKDAELRRAYIGFGGDLMKNLEYAISGSVSDEGEIGAVNAYITWTPKNTDLELTFGQFKTPMSLDESTSSKYTSTLERAAFTDAVEINRRLGIGIGHTGKKHTINAGVFGNNLENQPFDSSTVFAARATYAPISNKKRTLHFGASFRHRNNDGAEDEIRYRQRPYAHLSDRIISTGRIAESDTFLGVEAAVISRNFWAAGEYSITAASCSSCDSDPSFSGYYAEAGFVLYGRKTYNKGSFSRPKISNAINEGGFGAFALVVRYDGLDINNKDTNGGDLTTLIGGVDWWPTDHVRVGINYFNSDATFGNSGSGLGDAFNILRRSGADDETVQGVTLRVQYDF